MDGIGASENPVKLGSNHLFSKLIKLKSNLTEYK